MGTTVNMGICKKTIKTTDDIEEIIEMDKELFYSNPLHWTNNKRKMYGLPVLRGKLNKSRKTTYSPRRIMKQLFDIIYDAIGKEISQSYSYENFVDVKDIEPLDQNYYKHIYPFSTIPLYCNGVIRYKEDDETTNMKVGD